MFYVRVSPAPAYHTEMKLKGYCTWFLPLAKKGEREKKKRDKPPQPHSHQQGNQKPNEPTEQNYRVAAVSKRRKRWNNNTCYGLRLITRPVHTSVKPTQTGLIWPAIGVFVSCLAGEISHKIHGQKAIPTMLCGKLWLSFLSGCVPLCCLRTAETTGWPPFVANRETNGSAKTLFRFLPPVLFHFWDCRRFWSVSRRRHLCAASLRNKAFWTACLRHCLMLEDNRFLPRPR